jgi:hypothetical protein
MHFGPEENSYGRSSAQEKQGITYLDNRNSNLVLKSCQAFSVGIETATVDVETS